MRLWRVSFREEKFDFIMGQAGEPTAGLCELLVKFGALLGVVSAGTFLYFTLYLPLLIRVFNLRAH